MLMMFVWKRVEKININTYLKIVKTIVEDYWVGLLGGSLDERSIFLEHKHVRGGGDIQKHMTTYVCSMDGMCH